MLFVDMILALAVALSFIPILTGYCAHSRGRSFWLWFALGWLVPLASFFLLVALIARDELDPGRRLLANTPTIFEGDSCASGIGSAPHSTSRTA